MRKMKCPCSPSQRLGGQGRQAESAEHAPERKMDLTALELGSLALELRLVEWVLGLTLRLLVLFAGRVVAMAGRGVGSLA